MFKKIAVNELKVGMFVARLDRPWSQHPFLRRSFMLDNSMDLALLKDSISDFVVIDTARSLDKSLEMDSEQRTLSSHNSVSEESASMNRQSTAMPQLVDSVVRSESPLHPEFDRARMTRHRCLQRVQVIYSSLMFGSGPDVNAWRQVVDEVVLSLNCHPSALICLLRLHRDSEYTYSHALSVSALMAGLSMQLGGDSKAAREAALAGLLLDVGMSAVPDFILNHDGPLGCEDIALIRKHPALGVGLLTESHIDAHILRVVQQHHERVDGTGYPTGLKAPQICELARMASICDTYDALCRDRSYKKAWDPSMVLAFMGRSCEKQFDQRIFRAFVDMLGFFPIGSLVRLMSGLIAVVIEQNPSSLLCPRVIPIFCTRKNLRVSVNPLDLADAQCVDKIVCRENSESWKFLKPDQMLGISPIQ